ncbi:MAG: cysteine desulfurase [Clostridia bacterium]|nr:cysteine desulfurase [Clostridia bacterium]
MKTVYADYAASAPISERALAVFEETARMPGNPSSLHEAGQAAADRIEKARAQVAALIGADPEEIFFTSGGTESDNWAVFSGFRLACEIRGGPPVLAVSAIEHDAVLKSAAEAAGRIGNGEGKLVLLPVSEGGVVPVPREEEIPRASFFSVMTANNETGVVQPVGEWAKAAHARGALFHTDAVQAAGQIPVNAKETEADLMSLSAHKLHGPVGVGALFVRKEIAGEFPNRTFGGGQEGGKRPGTVPAALIAAFGEAAEEAAERMEEDARRISALRDLVEAELRRLPGTVLNGEGERLPGIANLSFRGVGGEAASLLCGLAGVMLSAGSACHAGNEEPSRVLLAMTGDRVRASSALRISLGRETSEEDARAVIRAVKDAVERIRNG